MTVATLLTVVVVCSLVYSFAGLIAIIRAIRCVPILRDLEPEPPARWPRVSLVVPARNEGDELEPAILSRLCDDYPNLEVIVVDDRSSIPVPNSVPGSSFARTTSLRSSLGTLRPKFEVSANAGRTSGSGY